MERGKRRGRTAVRVLAAAALLGVGGMLLWAGPRSARPAPVGTVVFLGDSITEYCDLAAFYPGVAAVNMGLAGDTVGGMLARLEGVFAREPEIVVVHGGINDLLSGRGEDEIVGDLTELIRRVHERLPEAAVVLQSLYPIAEGEDRTFTGRIRRINARLEALAAQSGGVYADVFPALAAADGRLDGGYSDDGLHPNQAGYRAACPVVTAALEKAAADIGQ